MLLTGQLLWLVCSSVGLTFAVFIQSERPLANSIMFGALACGGTEFLVINGAFTDNVPLSALLASVHPLTTFLIIGISLTTDPLWYLALVAGIVACAVISVFTSLLRRLKTTRGYSAIRLFQAFMKTWTSRSTGDLEAIISDHAEPSEVAAKIMRFRRTDGDTFIVLPGVHPGPFFPVGSYNLPSLISHEFKELGPVLTLHRPGGHERNLATNVQAQAYASQISQFAKTIGAAEEGTMRGPIHTRIGKAVVSSTAFSRDLLLTISFAPLGSDDLEPRVEDVLSQIASEAGYAASVVDAHNSIGTEQETPEMENPGWKALFKLMQEADTKPLRMAYSHSSEMKFSGGTDITENGIGLLMLESGGTKSILILADANNAVPGLREEAARALESMGYQLLEICTSDSHDLAARGLTVTRGYLALGEDTPISSVKELILGLAKLAETRLAGCSYGSGELTSAVQVFGRRALSEFASITQRSSTLAKRYSRIAIVVVLALFFLSLAL